MIKFIERVGNIKVFVEENAKDDITVIFINGTDIVMREVYFTDNIKKSIENLFQKLDTYTEEWLYINTSDLTKISDSLYQSENDYFKRIDDTQFFKHFNHKPMM